MDGERSWRCGQGWTPPPVVREVWAGMAGVDGVEIRWRPAALIPFWCSISRGHDPGSIISKTGKGGPRALLHRYGPGGGRRSAHCAGAGGPHGLASRARREWERPQYRARYGAPLTTGPLLPSAVVGRNGAAGSPSCSSCACITAIVELVHCMGSMPPVPSFSHHRTSRARHGMGSMAAARPGQGFIKRP